MSKRLFARLSSPWPGLAFILAGGALAQLGPLGGLPICGYAAIGCLLVGSIALMPRLSQAVFEALPLPRSPSLALALSQLRGAPGQAAVSLAAIVASFSLMAAMAIMVASFRQSVDDWLNTVLPAELYFRTSHAGDTGYLEPGFEERVRALPQVARADFLRSGRILLDLSRPPLVLIARDRAEKAFSEGRRAVRAKARGSAARLGERSSQRSYTAFLRARKSSCPSTAKHRIGGCGSVPRLRPPARLRFSSTAPITPRSRATGA